MSSASLAHVRFSPRHSTQPDTVRIIALSATMALNLGILLIASRPMGATPPHPLAPPTAATRLRWIDPPAVVPPPPAIVMKPLPHPHTAMTRPSPKTAPAIKTTAPAVLPTDEGRLSATPTATQAVVAPTPVVPAGKPVEANLAYRSAPLQFPVQAMREQLQGTVLLRVLVDENGKPLAVEVEQSSGHALLDRSARQQVASWLFQPAIVNGKAVRAWATVPVKFDLRAQ